MKSLIKMWLKVFLSFVLVPCLVACAGSSTSRQPKDRQLVTQIYDNGSKSFIYYQRVEIELPPQEPQRPGVYRKIQLVELNDRQKRRVDADMEAFVSQKGYCREGILVLERYYDRNLAQIRGECNETATAEDRRRFTNRADK